VKRIEGEMEERKKTITASEVKVFPPRRRKTFCGD